MHKSNGNHADSNTLTVTVITNDVTAPRVTAGDLPSLSESTYKLYDNLDFSHYDIEPFIDGSVDEDGNPSERTITSYILSDSASKPPT